MAPEKRLMLLREQYRSQFVNGESDEAFLLWVETQLKAFEVGR